MPFLLVRTDQLSNLARPRAFYSLEDTQTHSMHRFAHTVLDLASPYPRSLPTIDEIEASLPPTLVQRAHANFKSMAKEMALGDKSHLKAPPDAAGLHNVFAIFFLPIFVCRHFSQS